jgi:hypothetical protein
VLVLVPGEVVGSVLVSPVPVFWEAFLVDLFPRVDWEWLFTILEECLLNSASWLLHEKVGLESNLSVVLLNNLVSWIVLLFISGVMFLWLGPGILWSSP